MARGTVIGHLLECAAQMTGGYFADPGGKDVPDLAHIGFPYADVDADGNCDVGKVAGTGGVISLTTAKEQLLYEVTDPDAYVTPDVTADFTTVASCGCAGAIRVARCDRQAADTHAESQRRLSRRLRRRRRDRLCRPQRAGARRLAGEIVRRAAPRHVPRNAHRFDRQHVAARQIVSTPTSIRTKFACALRRARPRASSRARRRRSRSAVDRMVQPAAAARANTSRAGRHRLRPDRARRESEPK